MGELGAGTGRAIESYRGQSKAGKSSGNDRMRRRGVVDVEAFGRRIVLEAHLVRLAERAPLPRLVVHLEDPQAPATTLWKLPW